MPAPDDHEKRQEPWEAFPDVDPLTAPIGSQFVIQQHHATALHHDFRLEMLNDAGPVLVSWAVPKGLPRHRGERHLAIRTPDHSMDHATFSGSIPEDEYGGGEVRIFDHGEYEMVERSADRITFRLEGERLAGTWHLVKTAPKDAKEQWLALMREDGRRPGEERPALEPMVGTDAAELPDGEAWGFEPLWAGTRAFALCDGETRLVSNGRDVTGDHRDLRDIHRQVIAMDAILDGAIVGPTYLAFDLVYIDGKNLTELPYVERRSLLEEAVVPSTRIQVSPMTDGDGTALLGAAGEQGLPGVVAKRLASTYQPGVRSPDWVIRSVPG
jgi:bifunctional non-homologous end joining protein LigD